MSYFKNIDRFGNEILNGGGAPDFNPTPVNYTPSASGNTSNLNSFVIDPNGDMYFIDEDGESFKINTSNPLDVLTGIQPTPTATGNTTNLNSVFKDANGDTWVVDYKGDAIKAASAPVPETVTNITNTVSGHKIGTYTNESGVAVDINETITSVSELSILGNVITLKYVDENGTTNTKSVTVPSDVVTTITDTVTGHKIGTYTDEAGVTTAINETITSVSELSILGSVITLKYVDEAGVTNEKTVTLPAAAAETVTTIANTIVGHKIGDYTNESGIVKDINETITSVSELSILGNIITLKYIDEAGVTNEKTVTVPSDVVTAIANTVSGHAIGTYTNENGVQVTINETITSIGTISYNSSTGVLTIPYTDEAGVVNDKTVTLPTPLNVLTTVQPTPTATGNTTNLNSSFKDASGNTWIVDSNGDAILCSSSPFKNLNEFHVDPNGNDTTGTGAQEKPYLTIAKALTVAAQGDQVIVHAGVYTEDITMSVPNVALVGAQSEYGSLTQINGNVTVTATGTSVKIADITINGVSHTGSAPLYLDHVTLNTTLDSSSAGYLEVKNSSVQQGDITKSAGTGLIENSKIDNVNITGANTAVTIRDSYQDPNSTISYGAGTIYGVLNVQGGEISINASAIALETAALAQGLSAEMAKEFETSDFMKIGMIHPDTEASPTKYVTWDEATGRLEVSPAPTSGGPSANWVDATTDPSATGNTGTLPRFVSNTVNGSKWYIDANGVAKLIEGSADSCGVVYFDSVDPSAATIFDTANPPVTNNDALKNLDCALYVGTDGSLWTSNGTSYSTKVYTYPLHNRDLVTATAGQTAFTISKVAIGSTEKVHVTRNGIDISHAWTWVGTAGTYIPASNANKTMDQGDRIIFHYEAN